MAEIIYHLKSYDDVPFQSKIVWLSENDVGRMNEHLALCGQKPMRKRRLREIYRKNIARYCLLYFDGLPVARGSVEPYSDNAWEAADIRVAKGYRCRGFAKEILRFLSKYIIDHGRLATCGTEEHNIAMQKAMQAVGYAKAAPYRIIRLHPRDFKRCGNIWDMRKHRRRWRKWRREVRLGHRATFIYTEQGEYLGEGSLVFENDDPDYTLPGQRIYLSRMVVKRQAQGRGIGGILLGYLCEEAKRMGYQEMSLGVNVVNARARHLYEKHGFTEFWRDEDQYGKFIKMLKNLEQMS